MRKQVKYLIVTLIVIICVAATVRLFDWHVVLLALQHMHVWILIGGCVPVLFVIFALRGLRWLMVLGIKPTAEHFWQSFGANGAASGLASVTPFQLGEIVKIRMIPDHHGRAWRDGVSGFFVERIMDLGGMAGMGLCGLAVHFGYAWLSPLALATPLSIGLVLAILSSHVKRLPERMQAYAESFRHVRRIILTSLLTIPIWLLYTGLWWIAARALNVILNFGQVATLLGGVMLAVVASMTPGGLGVSELGSRGIMLWLGASVTQAETTAIALRLITPLGVLSGLICLIAIVHQKRKLIGRRGPRTGKADQ